MHPLFLIPGTMCDQRLWSRMLSHMPDVASTYGDFTGSQTLPDMIRALITQAPADRFDLVGFSLGGYLAVDVAAQMPERVRSLTIIAASPKGLSDSEKTLRKRNAEMLGRLTYRGMSRARLAQFLDPANLENKEITDTVLAMERDLGQEELIRQLVAPMERPDHSETLQNQPFPVHFVASPHDQIVPIQSIEKTAQRLENAPVHQVDGSGHMIPLEAPKKLAEILSDIL